MTTNQLERPRQRDWWVNAGMAVSAVSAAVSSFAGLRALAVASGWPGPLAALLPLTVDAYAMTATRVWLAASTRSLHARKFARWNAIMAIVMSLIGNGVWHLIASGLLTPNWIVVVIVGAVPAGVLGLLSHMAVLRTQVDTPEPEVVPDQPLPEPVRTPYSGDELLDAAREADQVWRTEHDGRAINRDALRIALQISAKRASEVLRLLKEERANKDAAAV